MIDVQEALRSLLVGNTTIAQYLSDDGEVRIYPNVAPEFTATEDVKQYIVYTIISRARSRHLRGPDRLAQTRMQIDIYSRSYDVVHAITAAVSDAIDGHRGIVETVNGSIDIPSIEIDGTQELYEQSTDAAEFAWYRVSMDLLIWHEMSKPAVARY